MSDSQTNWDSVSPARRMNPERRREHLIQTALRLYADQPPDLIAVDDVARAADVSRALFYRYFPNINELRMAALRTVVEEIIAVMTPPENGSLIEQVRYSLHEFLGLIQTYAGAYVALQRTGSVVATAESEELMNRVRDHIVRTVAVRIDARMGGTGDAASPAPMLELTMRSWFAVVESASVAWLGEGKIARDRLENWLVDQLVAMLATTARHDPATASQMAAAMRNSYTK
ncbi:TetR/AcrR family transcriptional regulator [Pseudonocardia spinosispora]|uniref:TetR/AcrR family transcriptional regulator n=1 Tax=Pseudonocardia spinosispora TaxID=103441 RepID=UPI0006840F8F|nr:TetR/AcrR family transcriptional regulator [Pseudonocardia spinosispora]